MELRLEHSRGCNLAFSKRKPYYGLKSGLVKFFREPVRFLKESNVKESQFEKPYRGADYPKMHLNLPTPDWPSGGTPAREPPTTWSVPKPGGSEGIGGRGRIHTIIFADPSCQALVAQLGCGDSDSLSFSIWNTPPAELGGGWVWDVYKAGADPVSLIDEVEMSNPTSSGMSGQSVSVTLSTTEVAEDGIITICASAVWHGTPPTKEITVDVPEGANPFFIGSQALGRPGQPPTRPSRLVARSTRTVLNCCQDVSVESCCSRDTSIAWDDGGSDDTISQNGTAVVTITGNNSPFTWSVSGTGFTFTTNKTSSLANTLIADADACGAATITVTGCDGSTTGGEVRCLSGNSDWVKQGGGCFPCIGSACTEADPDTFACDTFEYIQGKEKWIIGTAGFCYQNPEVPNAYSECGSCTGCPIPEPPGGSMPYAGFNYWHWECV